MNGPSLAFRVLHVGLLALCVLFSAQIVRSRWSADSQAPAPGARAAGSAQGAAAAPDPAIIVERNLFRVSTLAPAVEPPAEAPIEAPLQESRLPLDLLGTAASSDPHEGWAAILDRETRRPVLFRVGDPVRDDVRLVRVERRRVVLERAGRREFLALPENAPLVTLAADPQPPDEHDFAWSEQAETASDDAQRAAELALARAQLREATGSNFGVPREQISEAMSDPSKLVSEAQFYPKTRNGKSEGVMVSSLQPGSLLAEIGLQNGDAVTEVNGVEISTEDDLPALLRELSDAREIDLKLVGADGAPRDIRYAIGN